MGLLILLIVFVVLVYMAARIAFGGAKPPPSRPPLPPPVDIHEEVRAVVRQLADGVQEDREELASAMQEFREAATAAQRSAAALAAAAAERSFAPGKPPRPSPRTELRQVLEHKAAPPNQSERLGYWTTPPVPIVEDATILARVRALNELGQRAEICFTGWTDEEKEEMRAQAEAIGLTFRHDVAHHLTFICVGKTPGAKKLEKAAEQGVAVISGDQFDRVVCGNEAKDIPF
ncbi:MAG TPA: BRCT domain-containing protein [Caulobacteraceae bacterium]|jgi:NAD-dependent DNA ligase